MQNSYVPEAIQYNEITLMYKEEPILVRFRSGGVLQDPESRRAEQGRMYSTTGKFDPWTLEGELIPDHELAKKVLQVWNETEKRTIKGIAIARAKYSQNGKILGQKKKFGNWMFAKIPRMEIAEHGGYPQFMLTVSLSDPIEMTAEEEFFEEE